MKASLSTRSSHTVSDANRVVDPDARRYFKQSEIILYRQAPELPGPEATSAAPPADNRAAATSAPEPVPA